MPSEPSAHRVQRAHRSSQRVPGDVPRQEPPTGIMAIHQLTAPPVASWVPEEDLARHALGPRGVRQT